jgi:hypothetical protein
MEEELSEMWGKFSLLEDEDIGVSLETSELDPLVNRGKVCIIEKIQADSIVPKEFFKGPLIRAWRARVMEGRPWLFDGNLVSLAEFDGITPPSKMNFDKESFWMRSITFRLHV